MLEQANLEAIETGEWLESLDWVLEHAGPERARQLLAELQAHARHCGVALPSVASTPYVNTIVFYSIFGFQRVGDLIWAAGDQGARGFLIGATSGRTTLNGEGLQHQDGHSHLIAFTCPHVVAYDTAYACGWCQR